MEQKETINYEQRLRQGGDWMLRDLADVQDLIARLSLSLELADKLNPWVQPQYPDLWEKTQSGSPTNPHGQ